MIKKLMNISGVQLLSKEEQTKLLGGAIYACGCIGSAGAWTGNYANVGAAIDSIGRHCSSGVGNCQLMMAP